MTTHLSTAKLHDLVDGLLPAADVDAARAHVEACTACREEYARLSEIVGELRSLSKSAETPVDVWAGIEARISTMGTQEPDAAETVAADVVPLRGARSTPRKLAFSVPQLAAAAVVISFLSAATVWMALFVGPVSPASGTLASPDGDSPVRAVLMEAAEYDSDIAELEEILERGRTLLSQETLATLETSLKTIDDAINDVRDALERDPASELLTRMLVNHQRTKLKVLRQAATSVHFRS
jgi:anti-sigma factor RsiW